MHYPTRHPLPTLEDRFVAHLSLSPATRSQLCEALDTSRTNLGRALTTLLDEGSVVPVRSNAPGRGRPTQLLTLNASAAHAVGLLVTRTSCAAVMLSRSGTVLAAAHIVSPASPTLLECLEQTCKALSASATSQGIDVRLSGGVGGCVVSDFRLVGGARGLAGELGHITVAGNDALCGCRKRGCVETLASVPALCERAGARDLRELRAAVHADDEHALAALEGAARAIGYVLGSAALLINPKAIIVAGEIVDTFPQIKEDIAAHMRAELLPVMEWDIDVVAASLGPLGAAQGCAYIAAHPSGDEDADRERAPHRGGATASPGVGVRAGGERL